MKTIERTIKTNERYNDVLRAYQYVTEKYGVNTVIAGGAIIDCFYNKEFFDIDCFIYIKDLNPQYKRSIVKDRIIDVIRDNFDGFDLDIVVLGIPVLQHIEHFDICQKMCWLDNEGLHVHEKAAKDIMSNVVSLNAMTNDFHLFRLERAAEKYNMTVDPFDSYILNNFLSYAIENGHKLYISKKYDKYMEDYTPYTDNDKDMYDAVRNCIRNNIYKSLEHTIFQDDLKRIIANLY